MRKVLICIPCLARGGTERQTLLLTRALIETGYDVEVISYFENDESVISEFKAIGASITLLQWSRSIGAIQFIQLLSKIIREKKPSIIHVQYMSPGLLPIIAARLAHTSVILATVHYPGTPQGIRARLLLRFGAFLTCYFTCVSEATEKSWFVNSCLFDSTRSSLLKGRKHFTIPNAVALEDIDKALRVKSAKVLEITKALKNKLVIGTVARLSKEKGIDILMKAFSIIKNTIPDVQLIIVGEGPQMVKLKASARQLKIDSAITWTGKLSWIETMGCLGIMDVVVVPSRFEGFGLTAVEAMASQKPVVASCVDGLTEIIQDAASGFLVTAEDAAGFAERISDLLRDETIRKKVCEAARKRVEDNYSYPIFRERIKTLYEMF